MATDSNNVVIFDTPSRDGETWSHHVLRVLFSAHYKGIPFSIEGIEYPDINSTFAPTNLEPKDDPIELYEIPVLRFQTPTGGPQYEMNIAKIIQTLEDIKPEPGLLYASPRSVEFRTRFGSLLAPIIKVSVGHVPSVLSERSADFFAQKRQSRWGKSVEQWISEHPVKETLAAAEPRFKEFGEWLELTPGPFINGAEPGYADFTVASILGFARATGSTDVFKQVLGMHPAIARLFDAVKATQLGNKRCEGVFEPVL